MSYYTVDELQEIFHKHNPNFSNRFDIDEFIRQCFLSGKNCYKAKIDSAIVSLLQDECRKGMENWNVELYNMLINNFADKESLEMVNDYCIEGHDGVTKIYLTPPRGGMTYYKNKEEK